MPRWTDEQLRAIEQRDTNILLSAAAGSGKTTVLVERVIQLLRSGADIDRMLIVTFTRAASADMKEKLSKKITELARTEHHFRRQQLLMERASISTLHSFCSDLLRSNFEAADIDPNFRLVNDSELNDMVENALNKALDEAYAEPSEGLKLLSSGRGPKNVSDMVLTLLNAVNEQPEPEEWLELVCAQGPELREKWTNELVSDALAALEQAYSLLSLANAQAADNINYSPALQNDMTSLRQIIDSGVRDYDALYRLLDDFKLTPAGRKKKDVESVAESVKQNRKAAGDLIKKIPLLSMPLAPALEDADAVIPALRALASITLRTRELLTQRKRDLCLLTFNDLEHYAIRALHSETAAEQVRDQFDYVFVDEYQDTSLLQEYIISRITRGNNLFMVGDVKQSIYRFRQAEPALFSRKYRDYGSGSGGMLLHLTRNFRSCPRILEFVNRVFENCMKGGFSEIVYDENARLNHGNAALTGGDVELNILKKIPQKEITEESPDYAEYGDCGQEAVFVAKRIREMMDADKSLNFSDFAVLSRDGKGVLSRMAMELIALGIPAYAEGAEAYYESMEVRIAMSLLKLVKNRRSDIDLIGILHSSVVGLSVDDLAVIRIAAKDIPYCDAVYRYMRDHEDGISERLKSFYAKLDRWRDLSVCTGLGHFAHTLFEESGLYTIACVLPSAKQRAANIDRIVADAESYDRSVSGSLTGFLAAMERRQQRNEIGNVSTLNENDNVVRLMTIHKSKGLEFRFVFGVSLAKKTIYKESKEQLTVHRDLGLACTYNDPELRSRRKTLCRLAVNTRGKRENAAEQLRVLYVMLTRAVERLILVGTVDDPEKMLSVTHVSATSDSYLDIILGAFPDGSDDLCRMNCYNEPVTIAPRTSTPVPNEIQEDPEITEAIQWEYPHAADAHLPLKLSVSGVIRQLQQPSGLERFESRPAFMQTKPGKLTATEVGTAYHRVLQCLDLSVFRSLPVRSYAAEIRRQMEQLTASRRILPVQRGAVKPAVIAQFLGSDVGSRLLASETIHREWSFNANMNIADVLTLEERGLWSSGEIMVQGTIDACFIENGSWILLDYKTSRDSDEEALTDRYASQLRMYAHALRVSTGIPVSEIRLCLLVSNETIRIDI